mmetsp:Transcript_37299/g.90574  ORF Transcript_37299/g.90574 Transcript_37299/m.90574 type:complete len:84 (+) Transcript_37299:423-674(+)
MSWNSEVARPLIDRGANIFAKSEEDELRSWAPIHLVSEFGNTDIVQLLLDSGADIESQGRDKFTPFHSACAFFAEEVEVVRLL